ncbi:TolB family protein [Actinokineospora sp. HUAS TT18]|uniref:TolB family protein n=1 Tax=Actinokineospora sp. HUAS TT18 TaxID=3447451 RepID=UPI003F52185F
MGGPMIGAAAIGMCIAVVLGTGQAVAASPGSVEIVSRNTNDVEGNSNTDDIAVSGNGQFAAFESVSSNLVPPLVTSGRHIFLRNRVTGAVQLISKRPDGLPANGINSRPSISSDGRIVAFDSTASDLVPGDTNQRRDIFIYDTQTGQMTRVQRPGVQPNHDSGQPALSGDGLRVAFGSYATNITESDPNGQTYDILVFDRTSNTAFMASKPFQAGAAANGPSYSPSISADGLRVAFRSLATNLVSGDTNNSSDIFVTRFAGPQAGTMIPYRVSVATSGLQGNAGSFNPVISADGSKVAFDSVASNLVSGDTNGKSDVFVTTFSSPHMTTRVSVGPNGLQANGPSANPSISSNGAVVAFESEAYNLSTSDQNGILKDVFVGSASTPGSNGKTLVSRALDGASNAASRSAFISADGSAVAFISRANDLVAGQDQEYVEDAFIASF